MAFAPINGQRTANVVTLLEFPLWVPTNIPFVAFMRLYEFAFRSHVRPPKIFSLQAPQLLSSCLLDEMQIIASDELMFEVVDAATYLPDLCRDLVASVRSEATSVELTTEIESEPLATDIAVPMGLIMNELVTNALKHAFASDTKGTLKVVLKRASGELRLTVADNGKGIDTRRVDSGLGGRLVQGFAEQLGGRIERESGSQGTTVRMIFGHDPKAG